ncbi:penicillin-binding protein 1C [Salisaeta longa]|uniref:penicillin-binding protein 1C n=1 Tax=Salisaeta longa TaxID=503170 RepID=UPI0009FEB0E9|nr:penicillin-binding protein 1C [Salisaeta longa]
MTVPDLRAGAVAVVRSSACAAMRLRSSTFKGWAWVVLLGLASLLWPLPDALQTPPALTLHITARDGSLLRTVRPHGRGTPVALRDVHPAVVQALVATEDERFWWHPGIDPLALLRAAWTDLRHGAILSGGSTLTMQVARLLRNERQRGIVDKLLEMHLALRLSLWLDKRDVLALWLNRVSFGNRARGIEAAAQLYFGKSARDLTRAEAAYLVGLPQSPSRYNPFRHPARAKERQRHVLQSMVRAGYCSADAAARTAALPLDLQSPDPLFRAPHFTQWRLDRLPADASLRELRTTLDAHLQRRVAAIVQTHVERLAPYNLTNAAAVVLENASGAIRAYVGSADFWNARTAGQNDGVRMLRQPGSTMKPFLYALALSTRRYTPATILKDLPLQVPEAGGAFHPENYDQRYHGPVSLRTALASSYNVPAVRVARALGPPRLLHLLHRFGFASLHRAARTYGVGLTLGNGEVQLLELARAYAGLARGGVLPAVQAERWRRTLSGDTLRPALARPARTGLSPAVAFLITNILKDPAARAPGFGRGSPLELPFPVAVKTGTSKDYRDNWTVGYTPRYTVAVWAGNFDGAPMQRVSGVAGAGPIFHAIMKALGSGGSFSTPAGIATATICPVSGQRPGAHCPTTRRGVFLQGTTPADTCTVHRRVPIDVRTGVRATPQTPPRFVARRRFTVHPPAFHAWMRRHGHALPPGRSSPNGLEPPRPRITYPPDGARYWIDPVLHAAHQQIHLAGVVDPSLRAVHWTVDGERLATSGPAATWTLRPGPHTIRLQGRTPRGHIVGSDTVQIHVRGGATAARR